jgi:hypothetical protein
MPEQPYTDAQLSDGTTLRFMGQLGPDEVKQRVGRYKATRQIAANPPGVQRPKLKMQMEGWAGPIDDRMPGTGEGAGLAEGLSDWETDTAKDLGGGVSDVAQGKFARGGHRLIQGAQNALLPAAPFVAAAAPAATARALAGGAVGGTAAGVGAEALGADPDQQDLASDLGGIAGGYAGAEAPRLAQTRLGRSVGVLGKAAGTTAEDLPLIKSGVKGAKRLGELRDIWFPKGEPPTYPGAPFPTGTPEQINPAAVSPSRTMPGSVSPEVVRPPAQPIPPRSGLALPPAQTAGSAAGAASDTALFQQARADLGPSASLSDVAQRAQALKTGAGRLVDQVRTYGQAEPDLETEMRLGHPNPEQPARPAPGPDRLGTPEEEARIRQMMSGRSAAKQDLESGRLIDQVRASSPEAEEPVSSPYRDYTPEQWNDFEDQLGRYIREARGEEMPMEEEGASAEQDLMTPMQRMLLQAKQGRTLRSMQ